MSLHYRFSVLLQLYTRSEVALKTGSTGEETHALRQQQAALGNQRPRPQREAANTAGAGPNAGVGRLTAPEGSMRGRRALGHGAEAEVGGRGGARTGHQPSRDAISGTSRTFNR